MYFFDTYAIIEILKGNTHYKPYGNYVFAVSYLNIGELYLYLLRIHGKQEAEKRLNAISFDTLPLTTELLKRAVEFKLAHAKKELSWADCIGYVVALNEGMRFLTGDSQFEGLPNVQFVK